MPSPRWSIPLAALLTACASPSPPSDPAPVPIPVRPQVKAPTAPISCRTRDESRQEWLRCRLADCAARDGYIAELEAAIKGMIEAP